MCAAGFEETDLGCVMEEQEEQEGFGDNNDDLGGWFGVMNCVFCEMFHLWNVLSVKCSIYEMFDL